MCWKCNGIVNCLCLDSIRNALLAVLMLIVQWCFDLVIVIARYKLLIIVSNVN